MNVYQMIASQVVAYRNNLEGDYTKVERAKDFAEAYTKEYMPSGSGFDSGTTIDMDASREDRLVFNTAFHHMNDAGMYDGWTEHQVIVRPTFWGVSVRVSGRDRNQIKDYIADSFACLTDREVDYAHIAAKVAA